MICFRWWPPRSGPLPPPASLLHPAPWWSTAGSIEPSRAITPAPRPEPTQDCTSAMSKSIPPPPGMHSTNSSNGTRPSPTWSSIGLSLPRLKPKGVSTLASGIAPSTSTSAPKVSKGFPGCCTPTASPFTSPWGATWGSKSGPTGLLAFHVARSNLAVALAILNLPFSVVLSFSSMRFRHVSEWLVLQAVP